MKIGIIGGTGTMGEAIIKGLLSSGIDPSHVMFSGRDPSKIRSMQRRYHIVYKPAEKLVQESNHIFVCMKPQDCKRLSPFLPLPKKKIVISIMAGISINRLRTIFPHCSVIRAMPTIAGQIQESMTAWYTEDKINSKDMKRVKEYFLSFGKELRVKKEDDINTFTALIGSGPAYLYYLMTILEDTTHHFGYSTKESEIMIPAMLEGALHFYQHKKLSPRELIKKVASKGGTTEAALQYLRQHKTDLTFQEALRRAYRRAQDLSK